MTVLQVLPEVIRPEELLGRVALPELVHLLQMSNSLLPVLVCRLSRRDPSAQGAGADGPAGSPELVAAVAARVSLTWMGRRIVERSVVC